MRRRRFQARRRNSRLLASIIRRWACHQALQDRIKGAQGYNNKKNKSKGKHVCFKCNKFSQFIVNYSKNDNEHEKDKNGKKAEKKILQEGVAHIGEEWYLDCSSDSNDEGLATIAFDKSSLFPMNATLS
jgi:hypothetical protein